MDSKQRRMLELLDIQIQSCEECELCLNGRARPAWTEKSAYAIIGEGPGADEVKENTPFIGRAGAVLWEKLELYGYNREDFLIINSVNCRAIDGRTNGKPTDRQMEICRKWMVKYLKVLKPRKILILGGYALSTAIGGNKSGILKVNSVSVFSEVFNATCVISVHPAFSLYNPSGAELLSESIKKFKEIS